MKATKLSHAYQFLKFVWDNCGAATRGASCDRLNQSMRDALNLAISSGMAFAEEDFTTFHTEFRGHYWFGNNGGNMTGESFYRHALVFDNQLAVKSFERWKKRPPFIVDSIYGERDFRSGHFHPHASGRLALGFRFPWQGLLVTVTSFADDGQSLTACFYEWQASEERYKVGRRFRITQEALKAEMTHRRKAKKEAKQEERS